MWLLGTAAKAGEYDRNSCFFFFLKASCSGAAVIGKYFSTLVHKMEIWHFDGAELEKFGVPS